MNHRSRHLRTIVFIGLAALLAFTRAQDTEEGLSLPDLETRFAEALARIEQPVTDLNTSYMEALKRLMTAETEKANLQGAIQIKEEIERIGDGSTYDWAAMRERSTDHAAVAEMKKKYLTERTRLWNAGKPSRDNLVRSYLAVLGKKEKELTRLGKITEALEVREIRDALVKDPRLAGDGRFGQDADSFPANVHFVAKGEVELRHKGERLSYRNISADRNKYVDGTSGEITISPGDVILLRMRSTVVYRSFILTIESTDGRRAIPVGRDDIHYLGADLPDPPDEALIQKTTGHPDGGSADPEMSAMWAGKTLSAPSRTESAWVKSGPGVEWHTYAIVIKPDRVRSVAAE